MFKHLSVAAFSGRCDLGDGAGLRGADSLLLVSASTIGISTDTPTTTDIAAEPITASVTLVADVTSD